MFKSKVSRSVPGSEAVTTSRNGDMSESISKSKGKSCLKATGDFGYFDLGLSGLRDLERTSFTAQCFLKSSVPCFSSCISIKATVI